MYDKFRKRLTSLRESWYGSGRGSSPDHPSNTFNDQTSMKGSGEVSGVPEGPVTCSLCDGPMAQPPKFQNKETGPLAALQCIRCDRKPKGVW